MPSRAISIYVVTTLLATASCSPGAATAPLKFLPGRQVGIVQTALIKEASGIVASRKNPGVLWVHNDSGDSARVYAINTEGKLLGVCRIENAHCRDWEDIAIGPGPDLQRDYLYIGDIGDNRAARSCITVYHVAEPKIDPNRVRTELTIGPTDSIDLVYPDGAKDAETLMVDPLNGDIYVITKRELFCRVYRAAHPQSTKQQTVLKLVAKLPWGFAVGGDISPDGRFVIVRGVFNASLWVRAKGKDLWEALGQKHFRLKLMHEPQGEGICFDAAGRGYFTIGEMLHPPIHYFAGSIRSDEADD